MPAEPLVALVALNDPQMPTDAQILAALHGIRPELPEVAQTEHRENATVFRIAGDTAAVSLLPTPIEWSELEESCADAWYWPGATDALRGHVAHVLVAVQPDGVDRVRAAMHLTALAAALASTSRSAGVYWSASGLVHSPEAFLAYAKQMRKDALPLLLWIGFELRREDDGTHSVYSTGLREFNQMEIEVRRSRRDPQVLLDRAFDIAHYMLEKGAVLHHGETIGTSEDEKTEIKVGPSATDPETDAIQLNL
jgi:hypothetical protein